MTRMSIVARISSGAMVSLWLLAIFCVYFGFDTRSYSHADLHTSPGWRGTGNYSGG